MSSEFLKARGLWKPCDKTFAGIKPANVEAYEWLKENGFNDADDAVTITGKRITFCMHYDGPGTVKETEPAKPTVETEGKNETKKRPSIDPKERARLEKLFLDR